MYCDSSHLPSRLSTEGENRTTDSPPPAGRDHRKTLPLDHQGGGFAGVSAGQGETLAPRARKMGSKRALKSVQFSQSG